MENKINLCDSCQRKYPACNPLEIVLFGDGKGNDNIISCPIYSPFPNPEKIIVIEDTEEHFPDRFLTTAERKLLIAKFLKYTSSSVADTMPPKDRLSVKLADHNMIKRLFGNCPDLIADATFLDIGAWIRLHLTSNPEALGLQPLNDEKTICQMQTVLNTKIN